MREREGGKERERERENRWQVMGDLSPEDAEEAGGPPARALLEWAAVMQQVPAGTLVNIDIDTDIQI